MLSTAHRSTQFLDHTTGPTDAFSLDLELLAAIPCFLMRKIIAGDVGVLKEAKSDWHQADKIYI